MINPLLSPFQIQFSGSGKAIHNKFFSFVSVWFLLKFTKNGINKVINSHSILGLWTVGANSTIAVRSSAFQIKCIRFHINIENWMNERIEWIDRLFLVNKRLNILYLFCNWTKNCDPKINMNVKLCVFNKCSSHRIVCSCLLNYCLFKSTTFIYLVTYSSL